MNTKKIPLSLARDYVSHWSIENAIRELIQNALDMSRYDISSDRNLTITSYGGTLDENTLLMGNSSKRDDPNSRGKFGDGYKSALLVLCREGIDVVIRNGGDKWIPSLEYSELYNTECLHITIEYGVYDKEDTVEYILDDLDYYIIENVKGNTLQMQEDYHHHETPYGTILFEPEHKGKIFVGGLYISDFKSEYGYDFPPETFPLDRDRKSLNPFDIEWKCQDIFEHYSSEDSEDIAEVVLKAIDTKDDGIKYATVKPTNSLKNAAETLYNDRYSGKLVVSSYDEYCEQKEAGNPVELVNNDKLVRIITQTDAYQTFSLKQNTVEKKSIQDLLYEFKEKWEGEMSTDMVYDFEDMESAIYKQL